MQGLVNLGVYLALCLVLLLIASVIQILIRDPHHRFHRHHVKVRITKYVLAWYAISVGFTLFNKWFLNLWRGGGLPFPVGITAVHMFVKLIITRVYNRCQPPEKRIVPLPWSASLSSAVPIGVCTGVDVAFSNLSFLYISISFYTILKSGTLLWILLWAVLLRLEAINWEIMAICTLVSGGVSLASFGEASFSWRGFILVAAACCLSGLRWALTQVLLSARPSSPSTDGGHPHPLPSSSPTRSDTHDEPPSPRGGMDPMAVLYHISPASALSCIPVFLIVELRPLLHSQIAQSGALVAEAAVLTLMGGIIAFALIYAEVKLVKISSSLTMGLFGNIKEVVTIALSMLVFQEHVSALSLVGMTLAILGAVWYKRYKTHPHPTRHVSLASQADKSGQPGDPPPPGLYTQHPGMWQLDDEEEDVML